MVAAHSFQMSSGCWGTGSFKGGFFLLVLVTAQQSYHTVLNFAGGRSGGAGRSPLAFRKIYTPEKNSQAVFGSNLQLLDRSCVAVVGVSL